MTTTRAKSKDALSHIIENVMAQGTGSSIAMALDQNGYNSIPDFLMETDKTLEQLEYIDVKAVTSKLLKGHAGLLKIFKAFVASKVSQGITFDIDDWLAVTTADFDKFRITNSNNPQPITAPPMSSFV